MADELQQQSDQESTGAAGDTFEGDGADLDTSTVTGTDVDADDAEDVDEGEGEPAAVFFTKRTIEVGDPCVTADGDDGTVIATGENGGLYCKPRNA
jgi:hypothetical protein